MAESGPGIIEWQVAGAVHSVHRCESLLPLKAWNPQLRLPPPAPGLSAPGPAHAPCGPGRPHQGLVVWQGSSRLRPPPRLLQEAAQLIAAGGGRVGRFACLQVGRGGREGVEAIHPRRVTCGHIHLGAQLAGREGRQEC